MRPHHRYGSAIWRRQNVITYIARRLLLLIPVLFGLTILVFAIARLLPGDPVALAAGPNASRAEIEAYAREFGLDQPVILQYWTYLKGLLSGDWGVSIFTRRPVLEDLRAYLPATLELVFAAMLIAVTVGIPAGLFAGAYRNRWPDYLTRVVSLGAISLPQFSSACCSSLVLPCGLAGCLWRAASR